MPKPPFRYRADVAVGEYADWDTNPVPELLRAQGQALGAFVTRRLRRYEALRAAGYRLDTRGASLQCFAPLHPLGESLTLTVVVTALRPTGLELRCAFHRWGRPVALGRQRLVFVTPQGQPAALPIDIRAAFAQDAPQPPETSDAHGS